MQSPSKSRCLCPCCCPFFNTFHFSPVPDPQDPPTDEYPYAYGDDDNYGTYGDNYDGDYYDYPENGNDGGETVYDENDPSPDTSYPGAPAPDDGEPDPEAARYDSRTRGRDPCDGVSCPELNCPTRPYIPQGQCCPICPGGSQVHEQFYFSVSEIPLYN